MNTPILFLVFKKPNTTAQVINSLRETKPKKIYISINIPKKNNKKDLLKHNQVLALIKRIDWKCKIKIKKRNKYIDPYNSYAKAIKWFFNNEKEGIILEDDIVPNRSFFIFCTNMLKKYKNNKKISQICGSSFVNKKKIGKYSYFFSNYSLCWGYATWKRSIIDYDDKMKNWPNLKKKNSLMKIFKEKNTASYWTGIFDQQFNKKLRAWDYLWLYSNLSKNKISIIPKRHLVKNIGFVDDATHTKTKYKDWYNKLNTKRLTIKPNHPKIIKADLKYDQWLGSKVFRTNVIYFKKVIKKIIGKIY